MIECRMAEGSMKRRVDGSQSHLGRCGDEKNRRTGSSIRAARLHPFQKFGAKLKLNKSIFRSRNENFYLRI